MDNNNKTTVDFNVYCMAVYRSSLDVPKDIIGDDSKILKYIHAHLGECNVGDLEWISDLEPEEAVTLEDLRLWPIID